MSLTNTQAEAVKPWVAMALRPRIIHLPFPGVYRPQRREGSSWSFPGMDELALAFAEQSLRRHQRSSGRLGWFELTEHLREHVLSGRPETVVHGDVSDRVLALFPAENLRVDEYVFRGCPGEGEDVEVLTARVPYLDTAASEGRVKPRIEDLPQRFDRRPRDEFGGVGPQWSMEVA